MFQEEAVALLQLFRYIGQNRAVCLSALKSVGREYLKRFFKADIHAIIHRAVEQIGEEVGAVRAGIKKENMDLMTHFYVVAFAGMIESRLLGEIDRTPEELIAFADTVLQEQILGARLHWAEEIKNSSAGTPRRSFGAHFFAEKADSVLDKRKGTGYNKHMIKI